MVKKWPTQEKDSPETGRGGSGHIQELEAHMSVIGRGLSPSWVELVGQGWLWAWSSVGWVDHGGRQRLPGQRVCRGHGHLGETEKVNIHNIVI